MNEVDQLAEELTCQEVMLTSLEGETFEGADEARDDLRAEVARLKRLLEKAKRGEPAIEDEDLAESQTWPWQPDRATPGPSTSTTNRHDPLASGASSPPQGSVSTPSGRPITFNGGSASLPSRKRERNLLSPTAAHAVNKSRRTSPSPSPMSNRPFGSDVGDVDVIDLTGDDDISPPSTADRKFKQVSRDRIPPMQPSWNGSSQDGPVYPGQSNAFERIMNTQQLNYGTPQEPSWLPSSNGSQSARPATPDRALPIPGAFNPAWDRPGIHGPYPHPTLNSQPNPGYRTHPDPYSGYMTQPDTRDRPVPDPTGPLLRISKPSSTQGGFPFTSFTSASRAHQDPLSNIIQRTSGFDYVHGVDQFGAALPERVTNYLHDIVHDTRMSQKELDDLLQNIRPDMEIPKNIHDGTPEGLKGTLYRHQELALTWMKHMEERASKGGILADDMGLGKTISVISLMLSRKATGRPKTSLVVAPLALLRQWEEEIRTKIAPSHRMSTFIYHGKKTTTEELLKYDVVLTTYGTLAAELRRLEKMHEEDRQIDFNDKSIATKCPLLHPTKAIFYRVILDEAQCIKNKRTLTSKAACHLRATYRWCLTGTPMMNGVEELFSLIQFLRIKPYCHWEKFSKEFGSLFRKRGEERADAAMKKLRAVLKAIMLRRKKNSQIDGKPILRLPPKTEEQIHVKLSDDEHDFYSQLESKSQVIFNKYLRENSVGRNYSNILVLLLRLRQACCHPHLNLDVEDSAATTENMTDIVKTLAPANISRIKETQAFECPVCYDAVQNPSFFIPCAHDSCKQCITQIVDSAMASAIREGNEGGQCRCPICRTPFEPSKCFTYEAFRQVHMSETDEGKGAVEEVDSDDESGSETDFYSDSEEDADDVDKKGNLKDFIVDDEFPSDNDVDSKDTKDLEGPGVGEASSSKDPQAKDKKKRKRKRAKKDKGKEKAQEVKPSMLKSLRQEANKNRASFRRYMAYLRKTWLPSAKVSECMKLLQTIQNESGEKTIIFSQWTLLLDLLEVAMHHEGFERKPVRYDGSMSATQRNDAAQAFRTNPNVNVILVSLRAGNAGLNLTAASRVIILDPFWNPYIEMQAVDRAYRIGQQKEVKVYRILTTETVEDRIVELQMKKREVVEAALDEKESSKIGRLSTRELRFLFNGER